MCVSHVHIVAFRVAYSTQLASILSDCSHIHTHLKTHLKVLIISCFLFHSSTFLSARVLNGCLIFKSQDIFNCHVVIIIFFCIFTKRMTISSLMICFFKINEFILHKFRLFWNAILISKYCLIAFSPFAILSEIWSVFCNVYYC